MISPSRLRVLRWPAVRCAIFLRAMVLSAAACAAFASCAVADELQDQIQAARQKHQQAVKAAKESLGKAIVGRMQDAVEKDHPDAAKALALDKKALESDEVLPVNDLLADDVARYVKARRSAASAVGVAYHEAIKGRVRNGQLDEATKLEAEVKQFIDEELAAISLDKTVRPKAEGPDAKKQTDDRNNALTKERMTDFFDDYAKMLDDVRNRPTTAKQDEWHRNHLRRIDERIKGQSWELHCKIDDIQPVVTGQPGVNGRFTITHAMPDEYPSPDERWTFRRSALVFLTQQQAVTVKPGDYLVYTFTPRIVSSLPTPGFGIPPGGDTECFSGTAEVANRNFAHALHMTNMKMKFQKDADTGGASKAATKGQKGK